MNKNNTSLHCQCCNIVVIDSCGDRHRSIDRRLKRGLTKSSSENMTKYPFVECRIHSIHPKCKTPQKSSSNPKIHNVGPKSIFVADPSKTYALSFSDCCYELICGECASCFWIKMDNSRCYLLEKEKVDLNLLKFKLRSLQVDLPLQLRKYLNFDYNIFLYNKEEGQETESIESDNFQQTDDIIVGSFQPSSLLEFSRIDLFQ